MIDDLFYLIIICLFPAFLDFNIFTAKLVKLFRMIKSKSKFENLLCCKNSFFKLIIVRILYSLLLKINTLSYK